jgi:hypothetical protein
MSRYVVLFAATEDGIDIVHVLHSSRDVDANFAWASAGMLLRNTPQVLDKQGVFQTD